MRTSNKLTEMEIRKAKPKDKPYKLGDGDGLHLEVLPTGGRYWHLRYWVNGKEKKNSLGVYPEVTLKEAREKRDTFKRDLARGIDPRAPKPEISTFEKVAREWYEQNIAPSKSPQYAYKVITRLEKFLFPHIGERPINEIVAPEILAPLADYAAPEEYDIPEKGAESFAHDITRGMPGLLGNILLAAPFDPSLLGDSRMASEGAPIIGPDGVVESGNGRTIALKAMYERGKAAYKIRSKYVGYIHKNAAQFGINPTDVAKFKNPVLVRERTSDIDRVKFAQDANESNVAAMSSAETGMRDAARLNSEILSSFDSEKDILANRSFINAFVNQVVPQNERGSFMDKDGQISQDGIRRIQNALFAVAYGDGAALGRMAEAVDVNIRNVNRAMLQAAPRVAMMEDGIRKGTVRPDLAIREDVTSAANKLAQLREDGIKVDEFLMQKNLFGDDMTPEAKSILRFMDANKQRGNRIAKFLTEYVILAERQGAPNQGALFDTQPVSKADLIKQAAQKAESGGEEQGTLFQGAYQGNKGTGRDSIFTPDKQARESAGKALTVHEDVKRQLVNIGVDEEYADSAGTLFEAGITSFANREGLSPKDFYDGLGVTFSKKELDGARGSITFGESGIDIAFDPSADATTGLHELSHFFNALFEHQADKFLDDAQLQADWQEIQKFVGWKDGQGYLTRRQHEKLADEAMKYFETGEAPTEGLKSVFERFRKWLMDLWDYIRGSKAKLSEAMRGVFDRMFSSDATFASTYGMDNSLKTTGNQVYSRSPARAEKTAKIIPIDARALPVDYRNTKELIKWVKDELQGQTVEIRDDGKKIVFTGSGLHDSGKARGKNQRQAFTALKELVRNAVFDHFEKGDARHPRIQGQNVYYVGAKIGEGESSRYFSTRIKIDVPATNQLPSYKAHKVMEIALDSLPAPSAMSTRANLNTTSERSPFPVQSGTQVAEAEATGSVQGSVSEITLEVLRQEVKPSGIEDGVLYQFAGKRSKTADRLQLSSAHEMERAGKTNEEIRRKTGWFKGMDGNWRYEIPDNLDKINLSEVEKQYAEDDVDGIETQLGAIYDNEELYQAYPRLRNMPVIFEQIDDSYGFYEKKSIYINIETAESLQKSTLIHEIQHAIQNIEGFEEGGDPALFVQLNFKRGILNGIDKARKKAFDKIPESLKEDARRINRGEDADGSSIARIQADPKAKAAWADYIRAQEDMKTVTDTPDSFYDGPSPVEQYKNLAGEIEARDAAKRAQLSDTERQAQAPDIRGDAILIFGDSEMAYSMENPKQDPRLEPVESKNPNIEIFRKSRDKSNDTRWIDLFNSPNVVAQRYESFAPFYDMAKEAMEKQERFRANWNREIDKIFGKPGIMGRKDGLLNSEEQRARFNEILIIGDSFGKVFSTENLLTLEADEDMIRAYRRVRSLYNNWHRMISDQRNMFGKEDMSYREGYVPHYFHAWRVIKDGEIVTSFRTLAEAVKTAEKMSKDNPNDKLKVIPALDDFGGRGQLDAVTLGDMQYFKLTKRISDTFELSVDDAKELLDDVARMKNRSRIFKNARERKGSMGFDTDMEYAMRHYANLTARYLAMDTLKHKGQNLFEKTFGRFDNDHKKLARYTKNYLNDVLGVPSSVEETLNNWVRNSVIGKYIPDLIGDRPATIFANNIAKLTAHAKLGFLNISSALMNLTQLNGTQAIIGPTWTARGLAEYLRPDPATLRLYQEAGINENITLENPSGYSKVHNVKGALENASMSAFRLFDMMARKVTLIGAYRKALSEGKSRTEAVEYAKGVNEDVNFDYSVADTPDIIRRTGPIGTVLFQFKKFPVKLMELALPGIGKLKGMEQVRFWIPALLLSGLFGLPGSEILKNLIKRFSDDGTDIELEIKKVIAESDLPESVKKTILYGALSNLGIDVGKRVGMGDFIPSDIDDLLGPGITTASRVMKLLPRIFDDGRFIDVIEAASPGLANPIKAFVGETQDRRRDRIKFKYETAGERAARFTGARPVRESIESDAVRIANYEQQKRSEMERSAIDAYLRVMDNPDSPKRDKAVARLEELGIGVDRLIRELQLRNAGTEFERKLEQNRRKPEIYEGLMNYGGMGR